MKKFIFSILALAGFAACSTDSELNETIAPEQKESFVLNASMADPEESRVTIDGADFTKVSWVAGDEITLHSEAGLGNDGSPKLKTEEGGRSNVKFTGEFSFKADNDTYYAVYHGVHPNCVFNQTKVEVDYSQQDGTAQNAALLVGKAENAYKYDINMTFKPVNSLIHVSLTGATEALKSVVLHQKGDANTKINITKFSYDIATNQVGFGSETDEVITVTTSSPDFFIALPGGLSLDNGFELVFTTTSGKVFARSYKAMNFPKGTTTLINVAWKNPTVTLGAKTSYSYYAAKNPTMANKCDNSTIYFNQGPDGDKCYSSYDDIQDAMITDCGFEVDGTQYRYSAGQVTWKKEDNTFYMNNLGSRSWAAHTVKAFIDTKHNGTIASSANLHVTGLPYKSNPPTEADWSLASWNNKFGSDYVQIGGVMGSGEASCTSKSFYFPSTVNIKVWTDCTLRTNRLGSGIFTTWYTTDFTVSVNNNKLISKNSGKDNDKNEWRTQLTGTGTMANGNTIKCQSSYTAAGPYVKVHAITVDYL